jgi:hypothetical protein
MPPALAVPGVGVNHRQREALCSDRLARPIERRRNVLPVAAAEHLRQRHRAATLDVCRGHYERCRRRRRRQCRFPKSARATCPPCFLPDCAGIAPGYVLGHRSISRSRSQGRSRRTRRCGRRAPDIADPAMNGRVGVERENGHRWTSEAARNFCPSCQIGKARGRLLL